MTKSELSAYRREMALPVLLVGIGLTLLTILLNKYVQAEPLGYISLCLAFIGCAANKGAGDSDKKWQNNVILYVGFFAIGLGFIAFTAFIPVAAGIILGAALFARGNWFFIINALSCNPVPYTSERTIFISVIGILVAAASVYFNFC